MDAQSWIPWKKVGFSDDELHYMKLNPIKSTCGVCARDLTWHAAAKSSKDIKCDNTNCPLDSCEC